MLNKNYKNFIKKCLNPVANKLGFVLKNEAKLWSAKISRKNTLLNEKFGWEPEFPTFREGYKSILNELDNSIS